MLADYRALIDSHGCEANLAVLTSATRDASNGAAFAERVRRDYGLDARTLSGDEEAHSRSSARCPTARTPRSPPS